MREVGMSIGELLFINAAAVSPVGWQADGAATVGEHFRLFSKKVDLKKQLHCMIGDKKREK